jgi:hypothetical protein
LQRRGMNDRISISRRDSGGDEPDNLDRVLSHMIRKWSVSGGHAAVLSRGSASPRRGGAVSELRGAGRCPWPCLASRCRASTSDGIRTSPISRPIPERPPLPPIAMRDTDVGWTTKIVAVTGGRRQACRSQNPHPGSSAAAQTAAMRQSSRFIFCSARDC